MGVQVFVSLSCDVRIEYPVILFRCESAARAVSRYFGFVVFIGAFGISSFEFAVFFYLHVVEESVTRNLFVVFRAA